MCQNQTKLNLSDADRVFFTTTSMTEGIRFAPQPPWYVGYDNTIRPPDNTIMTSAARYGFRGSKQIRQYLTEPVMSPIRTRTEHTPQFLQPKFLVDEWAPTLEASTFSAGYHLSTPKLWPENAEYVTGYPKKRFPSSPTYANQTTLATNFIPKSSQSLSRIKELSLTEESQLLDYSRMERTNNFLSRPMTQQHIFQTKWNDQLQKNSTASLRELCLHPTPKQKEKHGLKEPTDILRYAESTALIVHSESSEVLKYKGRVQQTNSTMPHRLKWRQCILTFVEIKQRLKKEQTSTDAILDICGKLHVDSLKGGEVDKLSRAQFIRSMTSVNVLESLPPNHLSLLFSVFDTLQTGVIKIVEVVAALTILNNPEDSAMTKLETLWGLYENYDGRLPPLDICLSVLCTCCGSAEDRSEIVHVFKSKFRPACFRLAAYKNALVTADMKEESSPSKYSNNSSNNNNSNPHSGNDNNNNDNNNEEKDKRNGANTPTRSGSGHRMRTSASTSRLALPPAYNICDEYMNCDMFLEVLRECPDVTQTFDEQLSARLCECYGKDPR